jgi:ABC-type cobalamin transport system ATPase subunit
LLLDEADLVAVAACNIGHGVILSDGDLERLLQAAGRVAYLRDEVMS